jgi:hypothetical protein
MCYPTESQLRPFNKSSEATVGLGAGENAGGTRHVDGEHMGRDELEAALGRSWVSALGPGCRPKLSLSPRGVFAEQHATSDRSRRASACPTARDMFLRRVELTGALMVILGRSSCSRPDWRAPWTFTQTVSLSQWILLRTAIGSLSGRGCAQFPAGEM